MTRGWRFQRRLLFPILALLIGTALLAACSTQEIDDATDEPETIPIETVESDPPDDEGEDSAAETSHNTPVSDSEDNSSDAAATASERVEQLDLELELFAEGFVQPTDMVPASDGTGRLFVVSRIGTIHVIEDGQIRDEPLLNIRDRIEHEMVEQGMLSMALHPEFAENGYFYVYYISHGEEDTFVSRFEVSEDGQRAIPESESVILEVEQPHYSHNGGNLKFGPDGYLYIGLGDGENPGDPHGNSQDPGTLLGSILRIDVDGGDPYAIPPDNPFANSEEGRDEVWAYGLRNPWRFSFDPVTGDMFMVDVGQWANEEINVQPADSTGGENYGWPIMEGTECWEAEECNQEGLTMPVATYSNPTDGCAVIGGYPYHGEAYPELEGIYFFGDWCSGNIRGLLENGDEWVNQVLIESDLMINAFGLDHNGEIYVLNFEEGGGIFRITAN